MDIGSNKSSSNCPQPKYNTVTESKLAANQDSDVMSTASSDASISDSDYYELRKNSPARSDRHTDTEEKIHKLNKVHEEVRTEIKYISLPGSSSPIAPSLNQWIFPTRRPTCPNPSKTMALCHHYQTSLVKSCIRNNELVNIDGFLASWRRSSVGLIGSIDRRDEAEAMFARSGVVRRLGTRTQFSTPLQRTEWTRIVKRVGRVSGTQALSDSETCKSNKSACSWLWTCVGGWSRW